MVRRPQAAELDYWRNGTAPTRLHRVRNEIVLGINKHDFSTDKQAKYEVIKPNIILASQNNYNKQPVTKTSNQYTDQQIRGFIQKFILTKTIVYKHKIEVMGVTKSVKV